MRKGMLKQVMSKGRVISNPTQPLYDSNSDYESEETESEDIQKPLKPYTNNQLIDFVIAVALADTHLLARIHTADTTHMC